MLFLLYMSIKFVAIVIQDTVQKYPFLYTKGKMRPLLLATD